MTELLSEPTLSTVVLGQFDALTYRLLDADQRSAQFSPLFNGASVCPSLPQYTYAFSSRAGLARQVCQYKAAIFNEAFDDSGVFRYAVSVEPVQFEGAVLQLSEINELFSTNDQAREFAESQLRAAGLAAAVWAWNSVDESWLLSSAIYNFSSFLPKSPYIIEIEQFSQGNFLVYRDGKLDSEGHWKAD